MLVRQTKHASIGSSGPPDRLTAGYTRDPIRRSINTRRPVALDEPALPRLPSPHPQLHLRVGHRGPRPSCTSAQWRAPISDSAPSARHHALRRLENYSFCRQHREALAPSKRSTPRRIGTAVDVGPTPNTEPVVIETDPGVLLVAEQRPGLHALSRTAPRPTARAVGFLQIASSSVRAARLPTPERRVPMKPCALCSVAEEDRVAQSRRALCRSPIEQA
jgi:hypothetical protein